MTYSTTRFQRPVLCSADCACACSDQRTCDWCGTKFCVAPSKLHLTCSLECAAARRAANGAWNFRGGLRFFGGRWYIACRDRSSYAYARGVMEAHLGRKLTPQDIVHHINGDCADDRIENLELTTRAEHVDIHRAELIEAQRAAKARNRVTVREAA